MPHLPFRRPQGVVILVAFVALAAAIIGAQAPSLQPTQVDQDTAQIVVELLKNYHFSKPVMNDEISKKWYKNFFKTLDPQKYYFEKADIDAFADKETTLDDAIAKGDISFAKTVFEKYLKRSDERYATVMQLLDQKPDFTVDESLTDDPDHIDYPVNAAEANERWRKRIKLDMLRLKVDDVSPEDAVKRLKIRYRDQHRSLHQFDTTDLLEVYLTSLTSALDAHSSYMGPKTVEDLKQALHLSLQGIGASLGSEDGYAIVKEIIPGGSADRDHRLQPEDRIVGIQKESGEEINLIEMKLSDVVRYIRGPKGTKVRLVVLPAGSKERKVYELVRDKVELKEQHAKAKIIDAKVEGDKTIKIGVIHLPSFYGDGADFGEDSVSATKDCAGFLADFEKKKVDAVLIDLRGNGGGLLREAITLSGLFITEGPVVQVRDARSVRPLLDEEDTIAYKGPLVVLIDHQSASASEIFAGVIRDYGRGLIIGDSSTFGKGTVQNIIELKDRVRNRNAPDMGALKLTIQQFYRANGESTQIKGVPPHIHIPSLLDEYDLGEDKMDSVIKFDKVPELKHEQFHRTPVELVDQLAARSEARRQTNPKFQKQNELIKKLIARKQSKVIALKEEKFRSEYVPPKDDEEADDEKPKDKDKAKKRFLDQPAWESNFYNDEIIAIIGDYLTLGSKALASTPTKVSDKN